MASDKPAKPDVVTYGDHEMITPDTSKLRKMLRPALPGEADPVARAEEALAAISGDFATWMQDECERLDTARRKVRDNGLSKQTRQELFLAAHDIKGDSGTLRLSGGRRPPPTACAGCSSTPPISTKIPLAIVDQHVDAVRAIVREHARADIAAIAARAHRQSFAPVTDEFLITENQHRPDVSRAIQSPRSAPGESF